MKQTLEEAANDYLQKILESSDFEINFEEDNYDAGARDAVLDVTERAYIAGAEWQAEQSPWISVEEQPIPNNEDLVVLLEDGSYRIACSGGESGIQESNTYKPLFNVIAFMRIPTFDQILEANKDVLQRMKEKGD